MKRKELFKQVTAVTLSAMMAVTMVPTTAFASDNGFFAGETEASPNASEADFGGLFNI